MRDGAVLYDLHMTPLMRRTLAKGHRDGCACPARTMEPLRLADSEVKLVALTRNQLESIAACARWAFVTARGTERVSLRGLMRRARGGIVWIDERTKMLSRPVDALSPRTELPRRNCSVNGAGVSIPPHENVATKAGRRAVADELSAIAETVDAVWSCETGTPRGESPAQVLVDELEELAERLRA